MVDVIYKKCSLCGEEKIPSLDYFYKNKRASDGLTYQCKECLKRKSRKNSKIYYKKNKKEIKEKNRIYRENNRERKKEYIKEYYQKNKEIILFKTNKLRREKGYGSLHQKTQHFIKKYNLRPDVCGICGKKSYIYSHHINYDKWNLIVRCCKSCHEYIHSGEIQCPEPVDLLKLI